MRRGCAAQPLHVLALQSGKFFGMVAQKFLLLETSSSLSGVFKHLQMK
jgi:hypothetical protein